eukprot:1195158-Prorocentrum_minimum.AAC.4
MEVDEKPTEDYSDIGGLDKQIQELVEAIVLPMTHKERFDSLGIRPPKGILLYGPPGTGKTLIARACAAQQHLPRPTPLFLCVTNRGTLLSDSSRSAPWWYNPFPRCLPTARVICECVFFPADKRHIPQARRTSAGANVHWRRRQAGPRRIRAR